MLNNFVYLIGGWLNEDNKPGVITNHKKVQRHIAKEYNKKVISPIRAFGEQALEGDYSEEEVYSGVWADLSTRWINYCDEVYVIWTPSVEFSTGTREELFYSIEKKRKIKVVIVGVEKLFIADLDLMDAPNNPTKWEELSNILTRENHEKFLNWYSYWTLKVIK